METRYLTYKACYWLMWAAAATVMILNAWVSDDAFISFRVIDNFVNGHGLRWNIDERVQAFTHPLWLLLHIPFYALYPNAVAVSVALSVTCSVAAMVVAYLTFRKTLSTTLVCLLLPLMLSKSFVDFTTSGLENPLSYLLFAIFGYCLLKKQAHPYFWFYVTLTVSLALLNRLDTATLYIPAMMYLAWSRRNELRWQQILLGSAPLILWHGFSLFYYGFFFPNTKYAKLNTGISALEYIGQGILYFINLFYFDALSFMLLCAVCIVGVEHAQGWRKRRENAALFLSITLGVFFYMAYVISVGGDFMAGRFWTLPIWIVVWLLYAHIPTLDIKRAAISGAAFIALKYLTGSLYSDVTKTCDTQMSANDNNLYLCMMNGIINEKAFSSPYKLLYDGHTFSTTRTSSSPFTLKMLHEHASQPEKIILGHAVGFGYFVGPGARIIDQYALTDPLLARLPIEDRNGWRIGHFERNIPAGYIEAIQTGKAHKMHPSLAAYYQPLRFIVSGELWSMERLKTMVRFNMGYYDHYKEDYLRELRTP